MFKQSLCEFCSAIDLSLLQLPKVGDIRKGQGAKGYPIPGKNDLPQNTYAQKTLGTLDRVKASSATCNLCFLVQEIFAQRIGNYKYWNQEDNPNPNIGLEIDFSGQLMPRKGEAWEGCEGGLVFMKCIHIAFSSNNDLSSPSANENDPYFTHSKSRGRIAHAIRAASSDLDGLAVYQPFNDAQLLPEQTLYGIRTVGETINIDLITTWYHNCTENHGTSCGNGTAEVSRPKAARDFKMRLIDVATNSVVTETIQNGKWPKYVALSYVWGCKQRLMLEKANKSTLELPGALDGTVSQTIADAIHLTRLLKFPYIWVDALCIVQDDDDDKVEQIGRMCDIYTNSLFTLVAATGVNAESGIPGLNKNRKVHQPRVKIPKRDNCEALTLVGAVEPPPQWNVSVLDTTVWAGRGWTMQERAVSRRVLMFTDSLMYWACAASFWTEEVFMESMLAQISWYCLSEADFTLNSDQRSYTVPADGNNQLWFKFKNLVREYTQRSLTGEGDRLDAFSAIIQQVMDREGEHFVWGIPTSRFHLGLLWEPGLSGLERTTGPTTLERTTLKKRVDFPSWSWIGWRGQVTLRVEDDYLEHGIQPEIACFVLRNTPPRLISISRVCFDDRGLRIPIPPSKSPFAVSMDTLLSQPGWSEEQIKKTPDDEILVFWTETVRLRIASRLMVRTYDRYCHAILDESGNEIGSTSVHSSQKMQKEPVEADFIMVASHTPQTGLETQPKKIVLQIRWDDTETYRVAQRVNIGEVYSEAWENAKPERTLVVLK